LSCSSEKLPPPKIIPIFLPPVLGILPETTAETAHEEDGSTNNFSLSKISSNSRTASS